MEARRASARNVFGTLSFWNTISLRRNRESARVSQKRKREALDQVTSLQDEYEVLQKKVPLAINS
jgi:hypothetical protein